MAVKIYTVQISVAQQLHFITDPSFLDITVKSGNTAFAPTWPMVLNHKSGAITDDEYTDQYTKMMRRSYCDQRADWDKVLAMDKTALGCYCRADKFCHRHLLADMLVQCGGVLIGEIRG